MIDGVSKWVVDALSTRRTVKIADCVHFCAYRYGRGETNPYEQYAIGLAAGDSLSTVRARFVDYLRHFRPRNLGAALGVSLSRNYPLWALPWRTPQQVSLSAGWQESARHLVDVMTHFCDLGIPDAMLQREYSWHEDAFDAIRCSGYLPQRYSYITARELRGERPAYLLTDGNHRLSALSALGRTEVDIQLSFATTISREHVDRWPLVRSGIMDQGDALQVFDAYIDGNLVPARADAPASIV